MYSLKVHVINNTTTMGTDNGELTFKSLLGGVYLEVFGAVVRS